MPTRATELAERRGVALAQIFQPMVFTATPHGKVFKERLG